MRCKVFHCVWPSSTRHPYVEGNLRNSLNSYYLTPKVMQVSDLTEYMRPAKSRLITEEVHYSKVDELFHITYKLEPFNDDIRVNYHTSDLFKSTIVILESSKNFNVDVIFPIYTTQKIKMPFLPLVL